MGNYVFFEAKGLTKFKWKCKEHLGIAGIIVTPEVIIRSVPADECV